MYYLVMVSLNAGKLWFDFISFCAKHVYTFVEICGSDESQDCFIIDGKMTVMSNTANYNSTNVEGMICSVLNDEGIRFAHPAIESVACYDSLNRKIQDDDTTGVGKSTPTFEPVAQQIGPYSYLVSAAAAIVIVLGIYGYRRRHNNDKEEKVEVGPLDDSDLVNMSNSLSFEGAGPHNGAPAMDFTSIHNPTYTAQGGIEAMARQSYFPVSNNLFFHRAILM